VADTCRQEIGKSFAWFRCACSTGLSVETTEPAAQRIVRYYWGRKWVPCGETGHTVADKNGNCFQCGLPVTDLEGGTADAPCSLTQSARCLTYPNCPCGGVA